MQEGKFMKTACSAEDKHKNSTDSNAKFKDVLLYLHDLVYLLGFGLLILLLCFKIVIVSGSSMKNTLIDGDYLLLLGNTFYRDPQYGDIIVASKDSYEDGTPIVKRVIATEGQTVDIDFLNCIVYIDDVALDEPYVSSIMMDKGVSFPLTVEKGCLFVMGDNRLVSQDSRSPAIGLIDKREILGKAILLFLPGTDRGNTKRDFSRIEVLIDGR